MAKITYDDKSYLNENPEILAVNKCCDTDMNEIKSVINDTVIASIGTGTDTYDSTHTYSAGNRVIYDNKFYVCNSNNVTGDWDDTKWNLVPLIWNYNLNPTLNRYTTGEQPIGVWIDGYPIYRKVINITSPTQGMNINPSISNLRQYIHVYGMAKRTGSSYFNPIPNNYTSWEIYCYDYDATHIALRFSDNQWSHGISYAYLVLEYTKNS